MGVSLKRKLVGVAVAIAVCVLVAAGCGGGGSDSGSSDETSASAPSKAEFVKSADAICTEGRAEVQSEFTVYLAKNGIKELGEPGESEAETKKHAIALMETVGIPALKQQIDELKALEAPSDLKAKAAQFIADGEEAIKKGEGEPLLLFTSEDKLFAKSDKVAKELGFQVCGNR